MVLLPTFKKNGKQSSFICNTGFYRLAEEPTQARSCRKRHASVKSAPVPSFPPSVPQLHLLPHRLQRFRLLSPPLYNCQHLGFVLASEFLSPQKSTLFLPKDLRLGKQPMQGVELETVKTISLQILSFQKYMPIQCWVWILALTFTHFMVSGKRFSLSYLWEGDTNIYHTGLSD